MKKITKRVLPVLLGAMVTIPSISAFANNAERGNDVRTNSGIIKSYKRKSEITKEQQEALDKITAQLREGKITREVAAERIRDLGIDRTSYKAGNSNRVISNRGDVVQRAKLTEDQKIQLEAIKSDLRDGRITREEASKRYESLGIVYNSTRVEKPSVVLTEEQKTAISKLREEFKSGKISREYYAERISDIME